MIVIKSGDLEKPFGSILRLYDNEVILIIP